MSRTASPPPRLEGLVGLGRWGDGPHQESPRACVGAHPSTPTAAASPPGARARRAGQRRRTSDIYFIFRPLSFDSPCQNSESVEQGGGGESWCPGMGDAVRGALRGGGRARPAAAHGRALPAGLAPHVPPELSASAFLLTSGPEGAGGQADVPVLFLRPLVSAPERDPQPAIVFLHGTGASAADLWPWMTAVAARGICCLAVDARYHGSRGGGGRGAYEDALVDAWRGSGERPFLLDTVDDLLSLVLGWLSEQPGVDDSRIGMTGISLGGMMTVLATAADTRVAAAAPLIGTQGFAWAVDNRRYQARVASIPRVFAEAARSLNGNSAEVTPEVVAAVWDKLLPAMLETYDSEHCLPSVAPRPLCIVNGALDPRCPVEGLEGALSAARERYASLGKSSHFDCYFQSGIAHQCTKRMQAVATAWLLHWCGVETDPGYGAGGRDGARYLSESFVDWVEQNVLAGL